MLSIRLVDGKNRKIAALLHYLQVEILEGDNPLDTDIGFWWIVYDDANAVGFCSLRRSSKWKDAGYLCRSGVIERYRGKGIQKRLIRVREMKAKRLNWNWLISDTYYNPPSANSLINCGFKMYIPSTQYGAEGTCYWRKKI